MFPAPKQTTPRRRWRAPPGASLAQKVCLLFQDGPCTKLKLEMFCTPALGFHPWNPPFHPPGRGVLDAAWWVPDAGPLELATAQGMELWKADMGRCAQQQGGVVPSI